MGASIAYFGTKAGLDITVLEKKELASGTSSRCDGNILAIDKDPGFDSQMSLKSQELVNQLKDELVLPFESRDRKSTRLNSSHVAISYAVFYLKKKIDNQYILTIDVYTQSV